jgi:hypothetical protein
MHFAAQCIPLLYLQWTALTSSSFREDFVVLSPTEDEAGFMSSADTLLQVDIRLLCLF